ncbi:MAG: hypothetical protein ACRD3O_16935, partial [Terriglobia bacterium]
MPEVHQTDQQNGEAAPPFRVDVQVHELLMNSKSRPLASLQPSVAPKKLPEPVFPQHPELLHKEVETPEGKPGDSPYHRRWTPDLIYHHMRGWLFPYVKSRLLPGDFHPIIAYLFTEWKCNLDCHYCWAFDNRVKGISEETARRAIDWLHSTTCRVLALM